MKCCLCGREFTGYGNNPDGALDYYARPIKWGKKDRCCDVCNQETVLPGRIYLYFKKKS